MDDPFHPGVETPGYEFGRPYRSFDMDDRFHPGVENPGYETGHPIRGLKTLALLGL